MTALFALRQAAQSEGGRLTNRFRDDKRRRTCLRITGAPQHNRGASPPRSPFRRFIIIWTGIGARRAWIGSLRPRAIRVVVVVGAIHLRGPLRAHGLSFLEHDDLRSDWGAVVKIDDVVIEQA